MGERTGYDPGTFSWVELLTTDAAAGKAFYQGLFGWDYDDNDMNVVARIFVRTGSGGRASHIYRFGLEETRAVNAWRMFEQLERALVGDDQAA